MADRISERFSTNVRPRGGNGFPFAQAQIRSWLRRAHVIESKIFCIARARVPTDRLRPQPSENERLSSQRDSRRVASMFACGIWPSHGWDEVMPEKQDRCSTAAPNLLVHLLAAWNGTQPLNHTVLLASTVHCGAPSPGVKERAYRKGHDRIGQG